MSSLYVARHGQASFFSDDYDRLSPLGTRQANLLGEFWRRQGVGVTEVYTGTLVRQIETASAVAKCYADADLSWPEATTLAGLDEYDAENILHVLGAELASRDPKVRRLTSEYEHAETDAERYRTFHRLLEAVTRYWVSGDYESSGFESWSAFRDRVRQALRTILDGEGRGRHVAVFTSAGVVGTLVQTVLDAPEEKAAELHWRLYNCAVTDFTFTQGRISLDGFNSIAHLGDPELHTYR